jgi:hypothetical protein
MNENMMWSHPPQELWFLMAAVCAKEQTVDMYV